jgi:site-specific DNA recombinase
METLYCYIRVSTKGQESDGSSLEVQKHHGKVVADKLGMKFKLVNEGARSSTIHFRHKLEELKEKIEQGIVKNVWCIERSRMFRDESDSALFRTNYLKKYDVRLFEGVEGNQCNFDNLEETLSYDIVSKIQQYENEKRTFKSYSGKFHRVKNHSAEKPVFMGGTPLYGYMTINKCWVINTKESEIVQQIFDMYENGKSIKEVKAYLDTNGIEPRRTGNGLWNLETLRNMLKNRTYTGIHTIIYKSKNFPKLNDKFSYSVPKIINKSQFNNVQKIREKSERNSRRQLHFSLLGGFLVCECKSRIASKVHNFNGTKKYFCTNREETWRSGTEIECFNYKSLDMDKTNKAIVDIVKETVKDSVLLKEEYKKEIMNQKFKKEKNIEKEQLKIDKKLKQITKEINQLEEQIAEIEVNKTIGKGNKRILDMAVSKLYKELDTKNATYNDTEKDFAELTGEVKWLNWVGEFGKELRIHTKDIKKQRKWLEGLVSKIVVKSIWGKDREKKDIQIGHAFDIHFKMKIVNDKLSYKTKDKAKGYNLVEGEKVLGTNIIENISFRKGTNPLKKRAVKSLELLENPPITLINNSVTVE